MVVLRNLLKKIVILIIILAIFISFCTTPASYAKLDIKSDEFYYAGTQKGQYVAKEGVFDWLINALAEVADWIIGAISMAIRAPFIGWTALIERLLTAALDATCGLDMNNEISNTDLMSIVTSENNVTVQAIVYNQVPALDANFFKTEYNKKYSPTGGILRCKKCQKVCSECCPDGTCTGGCTCNGSCDSCAKYKQLLDAEPVIIELKKYVSFWYYTIRIIALAGMLAVLVFIGIKIALNTVASERAMYKRMLVDWVVGILIIFLIHYIMYFTIYINETFVNIVKEYATDINTHTIQKMELAEKTSDGSSAEYTSEELEIDIYEEIRTRAYDAKLVNGLIGMVLYMSMVYMAIRYTLVYLKRMFVIAVLMIMGPGVGFAYALQKALSGRTMALKKWLSEYIINVIIQTVHAIIYSVFISTVLVLSLKNVAGIVVALIVMNFSLKAEDIFRKVFNLNSSGLLKETDKAGNLEERARNMFGTYKGATAIAKNVGNSFYGKTVAAAGKIGVGGAIVAASAIRSGLSNGIQSAVASSNINAASESNDDSGNDEDLSSNNASGNSNSVPNYGSDGIATKIPIIGNAVYHHRRDKELSNISLGDLTSAFEKAKAEYEKNPDDQKALENYIYAYNNLERKQELNTVTHGDVLKGHMERLLDIDNYFEFKLDSKGNKVYSPKKGLLLGTSHYDYQTNKMVSDKNSAIYQLSPKNLLGFTDEDSKVFNENIVKPLKNGFLGTAAMFVGLSTFAFHPRLGMGLLAYGVPNKYGAFKKLGYIPSLNTSVNYKNRKYNFKAFSTPALNNMKDIAIERMRAEQGQLAVNRIREKHPNLFKGLRAGTVVASTLVGGLAGGAVTYSALKAYDRFAYDKSRRLADARDSKGRPIIHSMYDKSEYKVRRVSEAEDAINKQSYKQLKAQEKEFEEDALKTIAMEASVNTEKEIEDFADNQREEILAQMGYKYNKKTGELIKINEEGSFGRNNDDSSHESSNAENSNNTRKSSTDESAIAKEEIKEKKINDAEIKKLNDSIDAILLKIANSKPLEINSESKLNHVISELNSELIKANIISKDQKVEELFKGGRSALVSTIKRKTKRVNKKIAKENEIFEKMNNIERSAIKESVEEAIQKELSKGSESSKSKKSVYDTISKESILDRMLSKVGAVLNPNAQNGPIGSNSNNHSSDSQNRGKENTDTAHTSPNVASRIPASKKSDYMEAIKQYLLYRKDEESSDTSESTAKKVSGREKEEVMSKANAEVEKRKNKLKQALEVSLDTPEEGLAILSADDELNGLNSSKILEQLFVMKEINKRGKEIKVKGSSAYKKQSKALSSAETEYYKTQRDILMEEINNGYPKDFDVSSVDYDALSIEEKVKVDNYSRLKRKLAEKEKTMAKQKKIKQEAGPIININQLLNNL